MSRLTAVAVVAAGVVSLAVPALASAKRDVRATIEAPTRCDAAAGHRITVRFTLTTADESGAREPFGAAEIFVVLRRHGAAGIKRRATARGAGTGRYTARMTVPRGGIKRIDVGVDGTATSADGTVRPAPFLFTVVGDPCRLAR